MCDSNRGQTSFSENMSEDGWPAGAARTEYERSGRALADELARVLGNEFEVEYHSLDMHSRKDAVIQGIAA